jgi:signal transduction histidine kinase
LLLHAGLRPAIEDHVQKVTVRTGLHIQFKARGALDSIPLDYSTCLFRILQEGLQNVVKHANAADVTVQLSGSSHGIGLSLTDNGKGFDASGESSRPRGLGLISIQERLRILNGSLRIHSRPAGGTKVCAWIPIPERAS